MKEQFKIGAIVWRGYRYWNDLTFAGIGGRVGWNTTFVPYRILDITAQRIKIQLLPDSINGTDVTERDRKPLFLNFGTMQGKGKQYHARFHEYFYATKPRRDPELRYQPATSISILNLPAPFTAQDVNRAYKKLARTLHPDAGGTNEQFIELQRTRDEALRLAMP